MTKLLVLALFVAVSFAACLPAGAELPVFAAPPLNSWGVPVAYGNFGNGIVTTSTWSGSVGNSVATDSFVNNLGVPFGGLGGFGCGPFGFGAFGPWQSAFGGNVGTQASEASGFSQSTTFGLQPIALAFGGFP